LEDSFEAVSELLATADLRCCDFEEIVGEADKGDFVFADPPYTVKHNMNGFVKYNETIFQWHDQIRLRDACAAAARRGAYVVVTNADHDSVRDLYDGISIYTPLSRKSVLAGSSQHRCATTEAMFVLHA
jgi:DNA adenine methylase